MAFAEPQRPKNRDSLRPFLLILLAPTAIWGGYWQWVAYRFPVEAEPERAEKTLAARGQFGDMFGGINALFSAMAFAVLIYTMHLQRTELSELRP
jgi:hypothetical protein